MKFNNEKEQQKILNKVEKYFNKKEKTKTWEAGKDWVHYSGPKFNADEYKAAIQVLLDEWLILGKKGRRFEAKFAKELGCKYGVMTNSGSSANLLMIASLALGSNRLPKNSKIITPVSGFSTTVAPIIQMGFKPVFIDVELETMNIDLDKLEAFLIKERKTKTKREWSKALMFAHVLGNPPNMDRVMTLVEKYDLLLLEDCCDALGSKYKDKLLGSFGKIATCSFFPAHHMTCGEGGFVATNDEKLYNKLRSLRDWGRGCHCAGEKENLSTDGACGKRFSNWLPNMQDLIVDHKYIFSNIGFNLRPTEMQAAMANIQMEKLHTFHIGRRVRYKMLNKIFKKYSDSFHIVPETEDAWVSWFALPIIIKDSALFNREEIINFFESKKIQTRPYFAGNILHQPGYTFLTKHKGNEVENFPNANKVLRNSFFLGVSPVISFEQIKYIGEMLDEFMERHVILHNISKFVAPENDEDHITFDGQNFVACKKFIGDLFDNTLNYPNIITQNGVVRVEPYTTIKKDKSGNLSIYNFSKVK